MDGSWDMDALKVDLELVTRRERPNPEELLSELQKFSPGAVKEDYFSEATNILGPRKSSHQIYKSLKQMKIGLRYIYTHVLYIKVTVYALR